MTKLPLEIPSVPCKTDNDVSARCLKIYNRGCRDNSHLVNCENFTCPAGFIKCPQSYCIPILTATDEINHCPLGQEKSIFTLHNRICYAKVTMQLKDICLHPKFIESFSKENNISDTNSLSTSENYSGECPTGYRCVSYSGQGKLKRLLNMIIELYNVTNSLLPTATSIFYLPFLQIIEIIAPDCMMKDPDKALQHWNTVEMVKLDLSNNEIFEIGHYSTITSMNYLMVLNLSRNVFLSINDSFQFPESLEVIDLSHTSVHSLPVMCFEKLKNLRVLDLSYTGITKFVNMGLPQNFQLETLNIQGVIMTDVRADFFEGLTVRTKLWSSDFKLCCPQIRGINISPDKCHAPRDAISSCQHIVGDEFKRISVWVVGLSTIAGNGIVLIYRIVWNRGKTFQTAYGLFVTGLAVSDLLMGVYLMIIAAVDIVYADIYIVHEASWRQSSLCNFSGFLSTLSSETSTFLIGLITLDRFINISYPFSGHGTSKSLKWKGFISSWVIGFVLALIPAIVPEWQIYSSNGLCLALPLSTTGAEKLPGWEFSMAVYVILNFILFIFIALGQVGIFVSIIKQRNMLSMRHCSERRTQDMSIAKKLAFVAVSDFLCWFPIGIMGIMSLNDQEFDKETYAWMAVFVLPVNSALNPMIYTIPVIVNKLRNSGDGLTASSLKSTPTASEQYILTHIYTNSQ
ncbi:hypothetical protein Btru_037218 [Bulinus truncatus]|nr:hypothetical protein Btru_037218 [Bulinus truncatus]